jgi:hypothetical protein
MGIFDVKLQTQVQPMDTPVNQSTSTALGGLTNFVSAMGSFKSARDNAAEEALRKAEAAKPTYTQIKDQEQQANLVEFSSGLSNIRQLVDSAQITPARAKLMEKDFLTSMAVQGKDFSSDAFGKAYTAVTGQSPTFMGQSNTDMVLNEAYKTEEGLAKLSVAAYRFKATNGYEPNQDELAAILMADAATKTEYDRLDALDKLGNQKKLPVIRDQVKTLAQDFTTSMSILRESGVAFTPEMRQKSALQYNAFKLEAISKLDPETPQATIDSLFKVTDAFFAGQGQKMEGGYAVEQPIEDLQSEYKAQLTVRALQATGNEADNLIALGILDAGYTIRPEDRLAISDALANKDLTPSTPEWITDAGLVLSNDLISTAQVLISPEVQVFKDANDYKQAFIDAITPDAYNRNLQETATENWSNLTSRASVLKGYSVAGILAGVANPTDVYLNLAGLATAMATNDFSTEAVSFNGNRQSVSANLAPMVDALEKVSPQEGKAARLLLFYGLGKSAAEYDTQIKAEEQDLNIRFNPKSGTYELDINAALTGLPKEEADNRIAFIKLLNTKYKGDIVKATADNFKLMAYANLTEEEKLTMKPQTGRAAGQAYEPVDLIKGFTPDRAMRLLDLRNSRVYLDNLAGQIEPKDIKERRMNTPAKLAGETMSILAATEGTVTSGGITTSPIPESPNGYKPPEEVAKDTAFMGKVNSVSTDLGINPNDLLRVIEFETGKSFSPAVKNPGSSATGLIQFLESTAKDLGTTTEALAAMTAAEQMDFVGKYLAPYKGKIKNFGDVYMAVHWPAAIGKDEAYVMYEKGSDSYDKNKNLDTNGDGTVTRGETIARVISGTGGGTMTTPYTAEAEKMLQPGAQLLPPELTGGATAASTSTATPTQPMPEQAPTASPTLPEAVQGQQPTEVKTAANTPIDQGILDTIANLSQNAADVRVFTTQDELVKAYDNQEINVGSLVVINGKLMSVTKEMLGAK